MDEERQAILEANTHAQYLEDAARLLDEKS